MLIGGLNFRKIGWLRLLPAIGMAALSLDAAGASKPDGIEFDVPQNSYVLRLLFGVDVESRFLKGNFTYISLHDPRESAPRFDTKHRVTEAVRAGSRVNFCTPLMSTLSRVMEWKSQAVDLTLIAPENSNLKREIRIDRPFVEAHGQELMAAFDQCVEQEEHNRPRGLSEHARRRYAKLRLSLSNEPMLVEYIDPSAVPQRMPASERK